MSDNVDVLLTQIQDEIEAGKKFGQKRMVDPMELQELLERVRANMPVTIERAKEIVAKRNEILNSARTEADEKVSEAKQHAAELEANANARIQEAVQQAQEKLLRFRAQGEQIRADAMAEAARMVESDEITRTANAQADEMLRRARAAAEEIEADSRANSERVINDANDYSRELQRRTEEWGKQYTGNVRTVVEEIVNEAEEILAHSLTDIRSTQKRLQTNMTKSAVPPEFYAPEEPEV